MVDRTISSPTAAPPDVGASSDQTLIKTKTTVWEKPTKATKWAYGIPYFAIYAAAAPISVELKIFYTDTVLVPAGLLALATAIARAFDAITDPVMGWVSDRTQTRWGRRKPWIPIGVFGSALFLWMMFAPPESLTPQMGAVWIGAAYLFYYLFHTVWHVPYTGLGMELTPDYDDRTSVFGIRALAGGLGSVIAFSSLLYIKWKHVIPDERQMLSVFVGTVCVLMVVLFMLPVLKIKENPNFYARKGVPLIPSIRAAIRNKPLKIIMIVYILMTVTAAIPPLLMPFFCKYILALGGMWRVLFALVYVIATFISMPIWMFIARTIGKLHVWIIAACIGISTSIVLLFIGEGQIYIMGAMELFRGFAAGCVLIIGPAMLADIIDYDELLTAKRREAQFAAFMGLVPKFVSIFSATVPLTVLAFVGYNPTLPQQTPATLFAIRALFALIPIVFHIIIILVILRYPLSRSVHETIRKGIEALNRGENTTDPISGKTLVPIKPENEETTWFLDNFSLKELKKIVAQGTGSLISGIIRDVVVFGLISAGSVLLTIKLLSGSLTLSGAHQLKQGFGSCLIVVAGVCLTLMVFHLMRIKAAKKMVAEPTHAEIIQNHIINL